MAPVWFITGTSHGFGLMLTQRALKAGHHVIATLRNKNKASEAVAAIESAGGHVIEMDMTESQASIAKKVQDAEAIYGRIDYLVNNAGYSMLGPVELFTEKEATLQIQTNLFGPLYTLQAALPGMRQRRSGSIINFSSVAGQDSQPTCGLYAASKFSLEGLSEALASEAKEFGISVLIIEPGAFRTNFLGAMIRNEKGITEPYQNTLVHEMMKKFEAADGKQPGDPEKAVEIIFGAITGEGKGSEVKGKVLRLALGKDAYARITKKNDHVRQDMETAKELTFSTGVDV